MLFMGCARDLTEVLYRDEHADRMQMTFAVSLMLDVAQACMESASTVTHAPGSHVGAQA
jgi:hypothetical protein